MYSCLIVLFAMETTAGCVSACGSLGGGGLGDRKRSCRFGIDHRGLFRLSPDPFEERQSSGCASPISKFLNF
ncbi:hypothetical protein LZ30DRAFT_708616 [Colletotrichum cereale]|nr:hypothetical protein LZ30DRAFT_708616 [Colletotrichum cereale]